MNPTEPQLRQPSTPVSPLSCCAFCLRTKPSNAPFHKQVTECSPEQRQCFQQILGYDFRLDTFAVCKPCWKFMELVQDFRLRCLKANSLLGRICEGQLLESAGEGGWFSEKVLTDIESFRTEIQHQLQEMVRLETNVENSKGEQESTVKVEEIKVEPIEIYDESNEISQNGNEMEVESSDDQSSEQLVIEKTSLGFLKCKKCGASYTTEDGVKQHWPTCDGTYNLFTCYLCKATFTEQILLNNHMRQHELAKISSKVYRCRQHCARPFSSGFNRSRHEKSCTKWNRKCFVCKKELENHQLLQEHLKLAHPNQKHICTKCDKHFRNKKQLRLHECSAVPCPECGSLFSEAKDLMGHLKSEQCGERLRGKPTHVEATEPAVQTVVRNHDPKAVHKKEKESTVSANRPSSSKGFKLKSIQIINP